jgi:hypothetical protein
VGMRGTPTLGGELLPTTKHQGVAIRVARERVVEISLSRALSHSRTLSRAPSPSLNQPPPGPPPRITRW